MDYLAEIADHPDIEEAIAACGLPRDPDNPELEGARPATRDERIRCFYADSKYAARVWRQLRYCSDYRRRLTEEMLRLFEQSPLLGVFSDERLRTLPGRTASAIKVLDRYDEASGESSGEMALPKLASLATGFLRNPAEVRIEFEARLELALAYSSQLVDDLMTVANERPFLPALLNDIATAHARSKSRGEARAAAANLHAIGMNLLAQARGVAPADIEALAEPLIENRDLTRALAEKYQLAVPFSFVHERELDEIRTQRPVRLGAGAQPTGRRNKPPARQAVDLNLIGLAFSGGGIRSATFNLGVLQGLASLGILKYCDYLSTVSGGGYIGSWLGAWTKRLSKSQTAADAARDIHGRLSPASSPNPLDDHVRPIRWLREFSNYLTPEKGFFSADTWTMVAIYTRNAALNFTILFLFFAALLLLPQTIHGGIQLLFQSHRTWIAPVLTVGLLVFAGRCLGDSLRLLDPGQACRPDPGEPHAGALDATARQERKQLQAKYAGQAGVQLRIVIPIFIAAMLASGGLWVLLHADETYFPLWAHPGASLLTLPSRWARWPRWAVAAAAIGVVLAPWELWLLGKRRHRRWEWHVGGGMIAVLAAFLALRAQSATDAVLQWSAGLSRQTQTAILAGAVTAILLMVTEGRGYFFRCWPTKNRTAASLALALCALIGGSIAGALTWTAGKLFLSWSDPDSGLWHAITLGPPLLLTILAAAIVFQLGLLGALYPDERREWWGRMRAWGIIYSIGWVAVFAFAIYVPLLWSLLAGWAHYAGGWGAALVWVGSTYAGLQKSKAVQVKVQDPKTPPKRSFTTRLVVTAAPYVFIAGLLALVSLTIYWTLEAHFLRYPGPFPEDLPYWRQISYAPGPAGFLLAAVGLGAISALLSSRVGVNEFSMHHFYKNRLVRCYLGASRWNERKADLFTGFDPEDDLPLSALRATQPGGADAGAAARYPGPYPIVNAAVNLVKGDDLAWQERKATSFVFSPAFCGFDVDRAVLSKRGDKSHDDAYRPTQNYSNELCGIRLGTAMAISGAAAGSGMGRITTPASAFLMTLFNVRLGWWLGNPRRKGEYWKRPGPTWGLAYALVELLGLTNDRRAFINLSDGGHFENLGIYELVRRGCRFIIASDAGQDGSFALEDLGNVIRKCRTDFAVEIEMRLDSVRSLDARKWTKAHCAVGEIRYPDNERGVLVYLKPTITGDEPFDILEYYHRVPEFPHETTADQWFNESQFESYRQLGMHIAECTFGRFCSDPALVNANREFFEGLRRFWFPPSEIMAGQASNLTNDYVSIMERVRATPELHFLDRALFPSWPVPSGPDAAVVSHQGKRDAYYICNSLIQLMENVYFELDLETNYGHPHVEGWMSIFKYWASQSVFREAWLNVRDTYAGRFQSFYNDRIAPRER